MLLIGWLKEGGGEMMKRRRRMEMRFLSKQIGCLGDPKVGAWHCYTLQPNQSESGTLCIVLVFHQWEVICFDQWIFLK